MIRYISYGTATAAAVGLVVIAGVLGAAAKAPAAELTEALDNVNKAKSYKHVLKMTFGGQTMFEMTTYKQGERYRFEAGKDLAFVADDKGTVIQFDIAKKTATKLDVKELAKDAPKPPAETAGLMKKITDLKGEGVERLGEEVLGGKKVVVYAFKDVALAGTKTDWKVWVDPKQKVPVRMEQLTKGDKDTETIMTSEYSGWNEAFDARLFSTDLPPGYRFVLPGEKAKPEPAESDATVFIHAITEAEKAKSVTATATAETDGKVTYSRKVFRAGDGIRVETTRAEKSDEVIVADLKTGDAIVRDEKAKTAHTTKLGGQELQMLNGLLVDFAGMKESLAKDANAVKPAGEEKIGDRVTKVYDVTSKQPGVVWKVWIDPKTDLPVRAKFADDRKGWPTFTITFDDWNKELDAKLFNRDMPAGFKLVEPKK